MSDLIDRQAAIGAVETKIKKWNAVDGEGYHVGLGLRYTDVIDTLTELPSAQPRKGKWIRTRTMTHDGELYCDQCDQEHPEQKKIWNFCPNCGCRMEEGGQE